MSSMHTVKTVYGTVRLDDEAYKDYLDGKLWLTYTPHSSQLPRAEKDLSEKAPPVRARRYRHPAEGLADWLD